MGGLLEDLQSHAADVQAYRKFQGMQKVVLLEEYYENRVSKVLAPHHAG